MRLLLLLLLSSVAHAEVISLKGGVIGDYVNHGGKKALLMLHGFASSRNEVGNMYQTLANKLTNVSTLRIDFRGFGESTIPMTNASVTTMIQDAEEAIDFLKKEGYTQITVQGFSLGGGVAQVLVTKKAKDVYALSLWSSVIAFEYSGKESDRQTALKNGYADINLG